ncbi:MAG: IS200/IS605 family transposase [Chitinophagaceae bacterium]
MPSGEDFSKFGLCKLNEVEIIKGHISKDHIHLFVSVPLTICVSKSVQLLKGMSSRTLLMEDKNLQKQYWEQYLWAKGYFGASSGTITDEIIKDYIENQDIKKGDDFRISGS